MKLLSGILGALAVAIPFHRIVLYSDRALFYRDLARDLLAQKTIWAESVRSGHGIPLWNHFSFGGTPFYTMIVGSPLSPLNGIFLLFPRGEEPRALAYYLLAHYLLFYAGAYLLLRSFRCRASLSALMASSLTLSGFLLSVHNLGHLLAASVAVPWYFFFQRRWFRAGHARDLVLASAALAWPVYAGDPQFSYVLALLAAGAFLLRRRGLPLVALGVLSFLAAGAELLPTAADILRSQRLSIDTTELLFFSFHPVRLAELLFPLFFGNRYGGFDYWGESYVNFSFKQPFIFSVYPGILTVFALLSLPILFRAPGRGKVVLAVAVVTGFLLGMGTFLPVPLYAWLAGWVPLFGLFRYPERFLFWPLFALWLLASFGLERLLRRPAFLRARVSLALPAAFAVLCAGLYFGVTLREPARDAVVQSALLTLPLVALAQLAVRLPRARALLVALWAAFLAGDLVLHQSKLIWDQSKYIADGRRYGLVNHIRDDLAARKSEIEKGAAFRLGTENFAGYYFLAGRMDHTTSTTFAAFENLVPNTAGIFGIEDAGGYFSFVPKDRLRFMQLVSKSPVAGISDLRFYHDLMAIYYVPERGDNQEIRWKVNDSAQPYLFAPDRIFREPSFDAALDRLRAAGFRPNRDTALDGADSGVAEQKGERGNFRIERRDGREIAFTYRPEASGDNRYLVLNEGYDVHWRAYLAGRPLPVFRANGWSLATRIDHVSAGQELEITFRYENGLITLGLILSALWWAVLVAAWCQVLSGSKGAANAPSLPEST